MKTFNTQKTILIAIGIFALALGATAVIQPATANAQTQCTTPPSLQLPPSAGPQFNIYQPFTHNPTCNQDEFLIDFRNDTKGETLFGSGSTANDGDILTFRLYYHNGVAGTTANNTTLQVDSQGADDNENIGKSHNISAKLFADNATNGQISGNTQINLTNPGRLNFVEGSVRWFPNHTSPSANASTPLPLGQNGKELFNNGLNIGSIQGCWEFSGAVVFQMRVEEEVVAQLAIDKTVRNLTFGRNNLLLNDNLFALNNDPFLINNNPLLISNPLLVNNNFAALFPFSTNIDLISNNFGINANRNFFDFNDDAIAVNGDRLQFQIKVRNENNNDGGFNGGDLTNVRVRDILPAGFSFVRGTARVDNAFTSDDLFSGNGINIGRLRPNEQKIITFEANINSFFTSIQTLTNAAFARADNADEVNDEARVFIIQQQALNANLNVFKFVRNITAGQTGLGASTNANPGDRVLFTIQITTPNIAQINNVRITDNLPVGLNLVSGTTRLDGNLVSDNLISGGQFLGTIFGNQTRTITFEATVAASTPGQTLTNFVFVNANGIAQQQAFAQVVVRQAIIPVIAPAPLPVQPTKEVANLTLPNGSATQNEAIEGDTLQYTIRFTNNTGATLNNARLLDVLPDRVSSPAAITNNGVFNSANGQITWNLGSLAPGASASVSYQVKVQTVPQNGFIISNFAALQADNLGLTSTNEVRTTINKVTVKGPVRAITGANTLTRNIALASVTSAWIIFFAYLAYEYTDFWRKLRLKLKIAKIRMMERI